MRNTRILLALVVASAALAWTAHAADRVTGRAFATRSESIARNGMAGTAQPLATQAALDILRAGGSAVDAAIAANAVLGVVEPTSCGAGGDLFAMVWDGKKLHGLNASGRSPKSLTLEGLRARLAQEGLPHIPPYGPLPVSVPGAVDGWFELHGKFGKLPMAQVLEPAVRLARDGFPVSEFVAFGWAGGARVLKDFPNFGKTFLPGGKPPEKASVFKNPDLARTYTKLGEQGRDVFYEGEMTGVIDAYMKKVGGYITKEDLAAHSSTWVEPVSTTYRGYQVWELPPSSQGIAALQMLNLLEPYDLKSMGFGSERYLHTLIEAKKLAFADRAQFYADPDFVKTPVAELVSKPYAEKRRKLIGERAAQTVDAGVLEQGDTTYLTVADSKGMMVSLIQSNYRGMGSGLVPDGLGFGLQDRGQLFSLKDGHANVYAPGKRPFHTIIPAFVTKDGKPWLSFGVMGGAAQPQMHVQVLVNLIDFGMNLQEAGDAPRMLHEGSSEPTDEVMTDGGTVYLETGLDPEVERALSRRGHSIGRRAGGYGGYQAIQWDAKNQVWIGASESRNDGMAAGY